MCGKVSGYKNFETFTVAMEISNDRQHLEFWSEQGADFTDPDRLGGIIKEFYEYHKPNAKGVYDTLLQASLDAVDWREIASDVLNGVAENDDPYFDRFDVVEAWYLFLCHYHDGRGTGKTSYGRLSMIQERTGFRPAPTFNEDGLTYNGKAIYRKLVLKHEGGF